MTYKIDWITRKDTTTGKKKADATLVDTATQQKIEATIWGDFPNFEALMPGMEVEGEIKPASDPKYKPSLNAPRVAKSPTRASFAIKEAQDTKRRDISEAQANKGESIRSAGAQRDAVLIVVNLYRERLASDPILSDVELDTVIKKKIIEYRDWFLSDKFSQTLPF